jgi:DNA-binding GntR family transcriptional regulator
MPQIMAKYERVVKFVEDNIKSGEWPPGTRLPSQSQWRREGNVTYGTLRQAYLILQTKGLIVGQQGDGVFVAGSPLDTIAPRTATINGAVIPVNGGPRRGDKSLGV